ncbi:MULTISPECIES: YadA-like family protein [Aliivibrio]|nr:MULTISPECIES: YadA C-terminal domain-containing protein [Aliivibrio]MDD9180016.1 YadA C-terminal domain-containing protein [Aliivibrio sp. A6]
MIKTVLISSILIALLPKYAIAADIPIINKPYNNSDSGLLATRGSLNNVVDRVNENFNVVSDNLAAAGNAIQTNHEAIVAAQASNAATSASLDNVNQLSKLATFGTVVNAQNTIATNNAVQAVSGNLAAAGNAIQTNHEAIVAAQASNAATSASLDNVNQLSKLATFGTVVNAQNTIATNNAVQAVSGNLTTAGRAIQTNHEAIVAAQASNAATSASLEHDINAVKDDLNKVGEAIQANHDALANSSGSMDSSYTNDWNNMFKDSINNLQSQIDKNRKLSSRGIAGVAAMTNIPTLTDGSFSIGMGYGYFDGQDAYALGISKSFESGIAVKTSLATAGSKDTTFGVGASYSFR